MPGTGSFALGAAVAYLLAVAATLGIVARSNNLTTNRLAGPARGTNT